MFKVDPGSNHPLHGIDATRQMERAATASLPPHTLMQRAGLVVARLALAMAPHARTVWIACGPGNNGGDGLEAAMHLRLWGKEAVVTWLGSPASVPDDAAQSYQRALQAGVTFANTPPQDYDLCIDALLGIGSARSPENRMAEWITQINSGSAPVLAVDVPSGLDAGTGHAPGLVVRAQLTLSLLTLKPGLFTASGRDAAGDVWLDTLDVTLDPDDPASTGPDAQLCGPPASAARPHASHKGSYGDVAVIGGAPGMTGAALLAASAALHGHAGRVFVGLLDGGAMAVDVQQPELMFRTLDSLDLKTLTVVCGCGGGDVIRHQLPRILSASPRAVIDADAINSIANDSQLKILLRARSARQWATVLTPHPLEAARLLGVTATQVQHNRLAAAGELAQRHGCTVVLKGSGTVIAAPGQIPAINPTGNARLATAGTGDVLAGMIGARLAAGTPAFQAACESVYRHGLAADQWSDSMPLTAGALCRTF